MEPRLTRPTSPASLARFARTGGWARRRRVVGLSLVALTALAGGMSQALAWSRPAANGSRTSASSAAGTAEVIARRPTVSDDGRWVVYEARPGDASTRSTTVMLRDRSPGPTDAALVELSRPADGVRLGDTVRPVISGDGCVVAVATQIAYDLFRDDDTGSRWDVYRIVLPHCGGKADDWELVSSSSSASGENSALDDVDETDSPAVSQSGAVIAFTHRIPGSKLDLTRVSVVDLTIAAGGSGRTSLVGGTPLSEPNTTLLYRGQRHPDVSDDGRRVVFASDARSDVEPAQWGSGPTPGSYAISQVYVWDRGSADTAGVVTLVSADAARTPATSGAGSPVISGSGRFVAFESSAAELAPGSIMPDCSAVCPTQIYRYDIDQARLVLVSRTGGASLDQSDTLNQPDAPAPQAELGLVAADAGGSQPAISDDGSQIAFVTRSRSLFPVQSTAGSELDDGDVAVASVDLGAVRRISVEADGTSPVAATNAHPAMSGSGHVVVFDTLSGAQLPSGTVVSGTDDGGAADDVSVGRHVAVISRPAVASSPMLDVGTVEVGYSGSEWYVAVRNDGPSSFVPATVVSSNPQFGITGGSCLLLAPVAPGSSCTVHITLTPAAPGPLAGLITVEESLLDGSTAAVIVAGTGGLPALSAMPAGADLAPTVVGQTSAPISFDITNIGFEPTAVASVTVGGADPTDFVVSTNSCADRAINPTTSCSIDVTFSPTASGYRTASIIAATASGQYTTMLVSGVGERTPELVVADDRVRAGTGVELTGSGFVAGATVTIAWADGRGSTASAVADTAGQFTVTLPTRPNERIGRRAIVAQNGDDVATVLVEVLARRRVSSTGMPVAGS